MLPESRRIARLLLTEPTPEQWNAAVYAENLLQKSPPTARRQARLIRKRLGTLDKAGLRLVADGDGELSTHVLLAFDYFKANAGRVSASIHPTERDFHLHMVELQTAGTPEALTLSSFIVLCSAALGKPVQSQMVVMGDMSLGGTITQASNLAESLQVAFDAGAKRILLPMSSVTDIPSVPGELFAKFQTSFYSDPVDAVFKALGVE